MLKSCFFVGFILTVAFAYLTDENEAIITLVKNNQKLIPTSFNIEKDVIFELYTLQNPTKPQIICPSNFEAIIKSNFNSKIPTRFIIHGWQSRGHMLESFADAFFIKGKRDVNLIFVNWERASKAPNYFVARSYVNVIGSNLAQLIDFMIERNLLKLKNVSLIGFSLGAHVAGIAGKNLRAGKLPKIVGLDPASPSFPINSPSTRLDAHDAEYVEVIHTNRLWLGIAEPIGTTNFYPNTGIRQNGCGIDPLGACSHERAFKYFAESVYSNNSFYGYQCKTMEHMLEGLCAGESVQMGGEPGNYNTTPGIYYLDTNDKPLYAKSRPINVNTMHRM